MSRKIWRAFPELDKYDDETCLRYIKQGRKSKPRISSVLIYVFAIVLAVVIWFVFEFFAIMVYDGIDDKVLNGRTGVWVHLGLMVVTLGCVWMPCIAVLLVRDKLLHDRLVERIHGARCFDCSYTLVGLEPYDIDGKRGVRCPECGAAHDFKPGLFTESDLNPNLLNG